MIIIKYFSVLGMIKIQYMGIFLLQDLIINGVQKISKIYGGLVMVLVIE